MIWFLGEIVPDDEPAVSVMDRTFQHGIGLFETFRTWRGHATPLNRHIARITASANALGIPLDPASLPDRGAVASLLAAEGRDGDSRLRITMSGGTDRPGSALAWLAASPLPADLAESDSGVEAGLASAALNPDRHSPLGRHKTLNYWRRQLEFERNGGREALVMAEDGALVEGTRTNVFFIRDGVVKTAGLDYPILPGVMRSVVLDRARQLGLPVAEFPYRGPAGSQLPSMKPEWMAADEVFLTNSVRGMISVSRVAFGPNLAAPGPITARLWDDVRNWLERGEIDP